MATPILTARATFEVGVAGLYGEPGGRVEVGAFSRHDGRGVRGDDEVEVGSRPIEARRIREWRITHALRGIAKRTLPNLPGRAKNSYASSTSASGNVAAMGTRNVPRLQGPVSDRPTR